MKRKPYSAGAVKFSFWFMEFRKMVSLLGKGMDYDQIRKLNEEQNIFAAATKERRLQIFRTVSARVKSLDESFYAVFLRGDVTTQKQFALAAALAQDTLFFDFVREVIHEKMLIGDYELTDADLRIFFHRKQVQDEKAASWTDATILRLGRSYRTMLIEAGVLEQKKAGARKIYPPFWDFPTEEWLKQHAMTEIVEALSDR